MKNILFSILKICRPILKNRIFTIQKGLAKGLKRRFGQGFKPQFSLSKEEKFLQSLDFKSQTVYDIGAYIGLTTMFFARAVGETGKVIAFEPNPTNYQEAAFHIKLNNFNNTNLLPIGIAGRKERTDFTVDPFYPTRGTLATLKKNGAATIPVDVVSLDEIIKEKGLPPPDFIKIDVEGFEKEVLSGMEETIDRAHPELFIELHQEGGKNIAHWLLTKGYRITCIESEERIELNNLTDIKNGHVYCSV